MSSFRSARAGVDANRLNRDLNALTQPKVLVIDEIGYLPFDAVQASLLSQVICRRYQKNGAIGNKAPITLLNHPVATSPTERSECENSSCP